jgi:hypothetical protein
VCALDEVGDILGVCGFIKSNGTKSPDIWISYILTQKGAPFGLSLSLLEYVQQQTGCRTAACNNIRPKVGGMYSFLGWQVKTMTQYYRLNVDLEDYTICNIETKNILKVEKSDLEFERIQDSAALEGFDFEAFSDHQPYKDRHYVEKRYFGNPWLEYALYQNRQSAGRPGTILVVRRFQYAGRIALRVVDYIGRPQDIARCGEFLDQLMRKTGAEFCDWFAYGLPDDLLLRAGFVPLCESDGNIVPLYLSPPKMENVAITVTASAKDYVMFRADGDQDRVHLPWGKSKD